MSIIDSILDFFGLQRKTAVRQEKSSRDRLREYRNAAFDRTWERQSKAVTDFANALYEKQTERLEEFTRKIKDGSLTPEEHKRYMLEIFGKEDLPTNVDLPDNVKQALRDALEKRGREDEDKGEQKGKEG